jgi:hypothetical protein
MSLTVTERPHAECINFPSDIYIWFGKNLLIWSYCNSPPMGIWYNRQLFVLNRTEYKLEDIVWKFNQWVENEASK